MNNTNKTRSLAREKGGLLVLSLKGLFAAALIGLALFDRNTGFIKEHPELVIGEALVVGAGSAAAFYLIGKNRGIPDQATLVKVCGFAFLVFFGVHFLLELSGFNEIEETTGSKKLAAATDRAKKSAFSKVLAFLVVLLLIMFTLCGWDSPFTGATPAASTWKVPGFKGFMGEGFFFALFSALPFIMIVKDRGGHTGEAVKEFFKYFFLFYAGHFSLQYGGLYREAGFMPA